MEQREIYKCVQQLAMARYECSEPQCNHKCNCTRKYQTPNILVMNECNTTRSTMDRSKRRHEPDHVTREIYHW